MEVKTVNEKKCLKHGRTTNGMEILIKGDGEKNILMISGGPGNSMSPSGSYLFFGWIESLIDKGFRVSAISRKSNLDQGYNTDQMAEDIIEVIEQDFNGKVDCLIGLSYGGFMVPYIAAKRPELVEHFVMLGSAYKVNESALERDREFAKLMSQGAMAKASALLAEKCFYSPIKNFFASVTPRILAPLLNKLMAVGNSPTFYKDVLVEVEAEVAHDAKLLLKDIEVPVLVIGGDSDFWFSSERYYETAQLIPNGTLLMFPKSGHGELSTQAAAKAIDHFIQRRS